MHESLTGQLLWMAIAMVLAAVMGAGTKRLGQPKVLGALGAGLLIGTCGTESPVLHDIRAGHGAELIRGLSEFAAMLLLFRAGLEGNLHSIIRDAKVGWKVAVIGVIAPMLGAFVYMFLFQHVPWHVALFQGGVFTATSVGMTAAVLGELGVMTSRYAKIIISAAVIDDVLGLVVLVVCQAVGGANVDPSAVAFQIGASFLFVIVVPVIGHFSAGWILRTLNRVDPDARQAIIIAWMLFYGAAATYVGLAAIVGAYFAGVALEEAHFTDEEVAPAGYSRQVEHDLDKFVTAFAPVFFVYAGCIVDPVVFLSPAVFFHGLAFTMIAIVGKLFAGAAATRGDRLLVGVGMVPRGEVGIIFATIGLSSGILNQMFFGASMIMVLLSTVVTPPALGYLIQRRNR